MIVLEICQFDCAATHMAMGSERRHHCFSAYVADQCLVAPQYLIRGLRIEELEVCVLALKLMPDLAVCIWQTEMNATGSTGTTRY